MVSKDKTWVGGVDENLSDSFNNYIQQFIELSNTSVNENASTSYVTKRTISFDAGTVTKYIMIRGDLYAKPDSSSSYTNNQAGYLQLTVDSVQKFERFVTPYSTVSDDVNEHNITAMWAFYYEPTTAEKADGFTLDLDLHTETQNSLTGSASNNYWEVWAC